MEEGDDFDDDEEESEGDSSEDDCDDAFDEGEVERKGGCYYFPVGRQNLSRRRIPDQRQEILISAVSLMLVLRHSFDDDDS
jgi:hypothetical protein